ncbi:uncharacterized protein Dyak_GE27887 [Drosophila yakuba]|uniref:Kazal-like domain-containing protein n=2 Tax=Drosophila yakuba TaxID=7245 RepID=A0A0R1EFH7_DROYA|nr:uncharacterized protein Dyak_GE27887 [Drosophila yakuba]
MQHPSSQSSSLALLLTFVLAAVVGVQGDYDWYGEYSGSELDYIFADVNYDAVCPPGGYAVCATDGYSYHPFSSKCRLDAQNLKLLFAGKKELIQTDLSYCPSYPGQSYGSPAPAPGYQPKPVQDYAPVRYSSSSGQNSFAYAAASGPYGAKAVAEAPGPYPVASPSYSVSYPAAPAAYAPPPAKYPSPLSSYPVYAKPVPAYAAVYNYAGTTSAPSTGSTTTSATTGTTTTSRYPAYPTTATTTTAATTTAATTTAATTTAATTTAATTTAATTTAATTTAATTTAATTTAATTTAATTKAATTTAATTTAATTAAATTAAATTAAATTATPSP